MLEIDCNACENLCETSPEFVEQGVTDTVCNSLKNDTGLNPELSVLHNNCEDFEDMTDCLIGRMDQDIDLYEVCDWKTYMHRLVPNLYNYLKAMVCWLCGLTERISSVVTRIDCIKNAVVNLVDQLTTSASFEPQVQYARGNGVGSKWYENSDVEQNLDFSEANREDNMGAVIAPFDCVAMISYCNDQQHNAPNPNSNVNGHEVIWYTNNETYDIDMRYTRGQHFGATEKTQSVSMTCPLKMKKGEWAKCKVIHYGQSSLGEFRIHQVSATFIPVFEISMSASTDIGEC